MFQTIPTVTKNLLIVNLLAYLATIVLGMRGIDLSDMAGLHFFMASDYHLYQHFTYMFLHASFWHIFSNMFGLWMFGCVIENVWGQKKFLFYYIVCGLGASICQELAQYATYVYEGLPAYDYVSVNGARMTTDAYLNLWTTIGASGAVYGVILAFGMTFPNERMFIIPFPFPIKAKWFVLGYIAFELFNSVTASGDGIAHTAHLGGMLFGFLMIRHWNRQPGLDKGSGQEFFERMKRNFDKRKQGGGTYDNSRMHAERGGSKEADMEYNAMKKARQDEIDAILDKIRKSGYESLTKEEKKKLFDAKNT